MKNELEKFSVHIHQTISPVEFWIELQHSQNGAQNLCAAQNQNVHRKKIQTTGHNQCIGERDIIILGKCVKL